MSAPRFETSCRECAYVAYFPTYWAAREAATMHWEDTGHATDVLGGVAQGLRVMMTVSGSVLR